MKKVLLILGGVVLVFFVASFIIAGLNMMKVTYKHHTFYINKKRPDYTNEQVKIISDILEKEKPLEFAYKYTELIEYLESIKVPASGFSTGGFGDSTHLGRYTFLSVQYPKQNKHRIIMYYKEGELFPYTLFDDFTIEQKESPVFTFQASGDTLLYYDDITKRILKRKVINKSSK